MPPHLLHQALLFLVNSLRVEPESWLASIQADSYRAVLPQGIHEAQLITLLHVFEALEHGDRCERWIGGVHTAQQTYEATIHPYQ